MAQAQVGAGNPQGRASGDDFRLRGEDDRLRAIAPRAGQAVIEQLAFHRMTDEAQAAAFLAGDELVDGHAHIGSVIDAFDEFLEAGWAVFERRTFHEGFASKCQALTFERGELCSQKYGGCTGVHTGNFPRISDFGGMIKEEDRPSINAGGEDIVGAGGWPGSLCDKTIIAEILEERIVDRRDVAGGLAEARR